MSDLVNIVNKCKLFGSFLFLELLLTKDSHIIKKFHEKDVDMCKRNGIVLVDNGNISSMDLYQDDLHLLERGKCLLAKNFIFVLNNFLNMHSRLFWGNIYKYYKI